jgi:hypothetical protein
MTREECKFIATEGHNGLFWIRQTKISGRAA